MVRTPAPENLSLAATWFTLIKKNIKKAKTVISGRA
jgi:hypothetical protein